MRPSPARCAMDRLLRLETKYDRRIAVAVILSVAYVSGWLVLRLTT